MVKLAGERGGEAAVASVVKVAAAAAAEEVVEAVNWAISLLADELLPAGELVSNASLLALRLELVQAVSR